MAATVATSNEAARHEGQTSHIRRRQRVGSEQMPLPFFGMLGLDKLGSGNKGSNPSTTPPVAPFPELDHRLEVSARPEGIVVSSLCLNRAFKVGWGQQSSIGPCAVPEATEAAASNIAKIEARGVLGILQLYTTDYLLLITQTSHAASLPSALLTAKRNIWAVRQVLCVPLDYCAASVAIDKHAADQKRASIPVDGSIESNIEADELPHPPSSAVATAEPATRSLTNHKAFYWLPARFSSQPEEHALPPNAILPEQHQPLPEIKPHKPSPTTTSLDSDATSISLKEHQSRANFDNRVVTELTRELQHGYFLSYDHDPTHSLQQKIKDQPARPLDEPLQHMSLSQRADHRFWWNRWISSRLVEAGLDHFVYPVFQYGIQLGMIFCKVLNSLDSSGDLWGRHPGKYRYHPRISKRIQ